MEFYSKKEAQGSAAALSLTKVMEFHSKKRSTAQYRGIDLDKRVVLLLS